MFFIILIKSLRKTVLRCYDITGGEYQLTINNATKHQIMSKLDSHQTFFGHLAHRQEKKLTIQTKTAFYFFEIDKEKKFLTIRAYQMCAQHNKKTTNLKRARISFCIA